MSEKQYTTDGVISAVLTISIYGVISMKTCSKCKKEKPFTDFFRDKQKKDGLRSDCKECQKLYLQENKEKRKEYIKMYYENNKDILLEYQKNYRKENENVISEQKKLYHQKHKEEKNEYSRRYNQENKEEGKKRKNGYLCGKSALNLR